MKSLLLSILVLFSIQSSVLCQDIKTDVNKINQAYSNLKSISLSVAYKYYANYQTDKVKEVKTGTLKSQGHRVFSTIGNTEMIQDDKRALIIDKKNKFITVNGNVNYTNPISQFGSIDSVLKFASSVKSVAPSETTRGYELQLEKSEIASLTIIFNKKSYMIQKIIVKYKKDILAGLKEAPKVEIEYSNIKLNEPLPSDLFSTGKYVQYTSSRRLVPTKPYQNFIILNSNRINDGK